MQWWGPGFYEMNGMEPSFGELLNGHPAAHNKAKNIENILKIYNICGSNCIRGGILCGTTCVQSNHFKTCCCICFTQHNMALHTFNSSSMALCSNDANITSLRFDSNSGVNGYVYADNKHMGFLRSTEPISKNL